MTKVFISHAAQDNAVAKRVYRSLTGAGINAWLDEVHVMPGEDWHESVEQAMHQASHGLFLLSPASIKSPSAAGEYRHFLSQNKPLVVACVKEVDWDDVPQRLRAFPMVDLTEDFDDRMVALVDSLQAGQASAEAEAEDTEPIAGPDVTVTLEVEEHTDTQRVVDLISRLTRIGIRDIKVKNGAKR